MKKIAISLLLAVVIVPPVFAAECILRQSDAFELTLGPYVDATDGVTAETALTISQGDVILKKCAAAGDCGASAQKNDTSACAHDANGMYECDLNTTDTDTVGILEIWSFEAGAAPVFRTCEVIETAIYDLFYADGVANLAVNVTTWLGTAAATPTVAGVPEVDVTHWIGTAAATPTTAGVPEVDATHVSGTAQTARDLGASVLLSDGTGAGQIDLDSGRVLLSTLPTNCVPNLGCAVQGTLSGTHSATTADLGTNAPGATSDLVGHTLVIPAKYFSRVITAYDSGTGVATFDSTSLTLANSDQWYVWETAPGSASGDTNLVTVEGSDATTYFEALDDATLGRLPAALVGGRIDSNVGAATDGVFVVADFNSDVILTPTEAQTAAAAALDAEDGANFTAIPDLDILLALEVLDQGACDSGSTTTCVDAGRTEAAADYWRHGAAFRPLTGPTGQFACVVDFDPATDTLTFVPALTAAITTNTYQLVRAEHCAGVSASYTP